MSLTQDRNDRADALKDAVEKYAAAKKAALENQVVKNRKILQGRGAERMAQATVEAASDIVVDQIGDYLTGV
jgi:hypothetical protein